MKIYKVIFGNYYPREVDSEYKTKEEAQKRADELGDRWEVEEYEV